MKYEDSHIREALSLIAKNDLRSGRWWSIVFGLLMIVFGIVASIDSESGDAVGVEPLLYFLAAVVSFLWPDVVVPFFLRWRRFMHYRSNPGFKRTLTVSILPDALHIAQGEAVSMIKWSAISSVQVGESVLIVNDAYGRPLILLPMGDIKDSGGVGIPHKI